jgi:hypothetical protein
MSAHFEAEQDVSMVSLFNIDTLDQVSNNKKSHTNLQHIYLNIVLECWVDRLVEIETFGSRRVNKMKSSR